MPKIATRELPEAAPGPPITAPESPEFYDGEALDPEFTEALELPPAKRGPGRPRTKADPAELPAPRKFNLKTQEFFEYWKSLEEIDPNRLIVYAFRTWPIIDKRADNPEALLNIGKMEKCPDPDDWRHDMLHRWGSGGYKLMLKDEGLRKPKAIAKTYISHGDLNDPDYPPYLESMDELVVNHPDNQSYIEGLKQKGLWPGEKEMATGEMVAGLTGTIERLSDKLSEKIKEPAPAAAQSATDTAKATVEMAGEVFKQGIALGQASVEAQADAKVKAAEAQVAAANPMSSFDTLTKLVSLVKEMQPPAKPEATTEAKGGGSLAEFTAMVNSFMGREATLQGKIMEILQAQIASMELRHQAAVIQKQAPAAKDDLVASLEKLASIKDKLQGLFGGGDSDEREEKVPAWMGLAQSIMGAVPAAATAGIAMTYNLAIARTGNGIPIPPGTAETPSLPPAPDNPNPTAGEKPMAASVYATFLSQIERPLINHLNDPSKTGADFADWVSSGFGDIGYQAAKELGKDTLLALLSSRPSIASVIQQIPERTSQFIDEFLTVDEMPDEGDDEPADGVRVFVAPAAGAAEVVDLPPIVQSQEGVKGKREG